MNSVKIRGVVLSQALLLSFLFCCSSQMKVNTTSPAAATEGDRHFAGEDAYLLPEYTLGLGDEIEVKFFNNERFNESVVVRPDGRISLEKVGDIFVLGFTPSQLDSIVTAIYARIITEPDVTVFVRRFGGHQVYVVGEVEAPGAYSMQRNMTVLQAITMAGGPKPTAKLKSTMIIRRDEAGPVTALALDLSRPVVNDGNAYTSNDRFVEPMDIIYVPETFISNVNRFLTQAYDGVLPPLDVYLRSLWYSRWTK